MPKIMGATIDTITFATLTTASTSTDYGTSTLGYNLTFITIINNGDNAITIAQASDSYASSMSLDTGQGISFQAENFDVLPQMRVTTGSGTCSVSIAHN